MYINGNNSKPLTTSGIRYGSNGCLYEGDPLRFHSKYLLYNIDEAIEGRDLVQMGRCSNSVKKVALLVDNKRAPLELTWTGW